MAKYCPSCGRSMPEDGNMCPYCGKLVAKHEGIMVQSSPKLEEKKDNKALIIAIVVIVLLIVPIAIAATVYVYVSGMMGSEMSEIMKTPNMAAMITPDSGNNATLFVTYIDTDDVYWSFVSFQIYDVTDGKTLSKYSDYTTDISYGYIGTGDSIKFTGQGGEFEENQEYRITLVYSITGEIMYSYTWTQ